MDFAVYCSRNLYSEWSVNGISLMWICYACLHVLSICNLARMRIGQYCFIMAESIICNTYSVLVQYETVLMLSCESFSCRIRFKSVILRCRRVHVSLIQLIKSINVISITLILITLFSWTAHMDQWLFITKQKNGTRKVTTLYMSRWFCYYNIYQ